MNAPRCHNHARNVEVIEPGAYAESPRALAEKVRRFVSPSSVVSAAVSWMYVPRPGWALVA